MMNRYESAVMEWEATWDEYVAINNAVCDYAVDFNNYFTPNYDSVLLAMTNYLSNIQNEASQEVSYHRHTLIPLGQ